ncbi:DNA translocase FtsK [candidate division WWE3 bacterium]|jgi:DNA segregation ATPase FtsK/SpoIIIE, S-DNA-T family|nr:DNA translocase FtsK [candidate division WWE3 bacterium]MBT7350381.1 DNA translocase FtsK [candidate division WWE3 bacterium]
MARRGRKRKVKLNVKKDTLQSGVTILLLVLAALILVSLFAPGYSINAKVNKIVTDLFGYASILVPVILALGALIQTPALKWKYVELRVLLGFVVLTISSAAFFALVGMSGGMIGENIASVLSGAISFVGALLLLLAAVIGSAIFIADMSLEEITELTKATKEKLGKIKPGKKTDEKEDEIKITSGSQVLDEDWSEEKEGEKKEVDLPEPSFEVVPSLSEPKSSKGIAVPGEESESASIAPGLPYSDRIWEPPPMDLLVEPSTAPIDRGDVKARVAIIVDTLQSFGVDAVVEEINYGPSVTQYALKASSGTRIARVSSLQHDLALALASPTGSVRIEAPIPGKSLIGIEVPNNTIVPVHFKEILTSDAMKGMKSKRGIVLGKDVSGLTRVYDIARMPHLLVAGATGSGKSVFLHSLIFSLLYRCSPQECKFIFIDPKRVELVHYAGIPHLLSPVVTDIEKASSVFRWAVQEMERRYKLLETAKVRNIDGYNEKSGFQALPYIVIVVDELAEIMVADPAQVEKSIIRLAQLARATGIHLILTVQRPSTNIITGLIKANIPSRVAFNVTSQVDSRVIIDQPGAEKLLGKGDMLFMPPDASKPIRVQGAFVTEKEISRLVNYLKSLGSGPEYNEEVFQVKDTAKKSVSAGGESKDALFDEAIEVVTTAGKASASLLQRRLSIGYARAARILDELEAEGAVGPSKGSKPRDVLLGGAGIEVLDGVSSDNLEDVEEGSLEEPIF